MNQEESLLLPTTDKEIIQFMYDRAHELYESIKDDYVSDVDDPDVKFIDIVDKKMNVILNIARNSAILKKLSAVYDKNTVGRAQNNAKDLQYQKFIQTLKEIRTIYINIMKAHKDWNKFKDNNVYLYSGLASIPSTKDGIMNINIPLDTTLLANQYYVENNDMHYLQFKTKLDGPFIPILQLASLKLYDILQIKEMDEYEIFLLPIGEINYKSLGQPKMKYKYMGDFVYRPTLDIICQSRLSGSYYYIKILNKYTDTYKLDEESNFSYIYDTIINIFTNLPDSIIAKPKKMTLNLGFIINLLTNLQKGKINYDYDNDYDSDIGPNDNRILFVYFFVKLAKKYKIFEETIIDEDGDTDYNYDLIDIFLDNMNYLYNIMLKIYKDDEKSIEFIKKLNTDFFTDEHFIKVIKNKYYLPVIGEHEYQPHFYSIDLTQLAGGGTYKKHKTKSNIKHKNKSKNTSKNNKNNKRKKTKLKIDKSKKNIHYKLKYKIQN